MKTIHKKISSGLIGILTVLSIFTMLSQASAMGSITNYNYVDDVNIIWGFKQGTYRETYTKNDDWYCIGSRSWIIMKMQSINAKIYFNDYTYSSAIDYVFEYHMERDGFQFNGISIRLYYTDGSFRELTSYQEEIVSGSFTLTKEVDYVKIRYDEAITTGRVWIDLLRIKQTFWI